MKPLSAKDLYHRLVPATLRYPVGRCRRTVLDRFIRWRTPGPPLPPRAMLRSVQMTPWVWEYLEVGHVSAATIRSALADAGLTSDSAFPPRVLDFGCGLGRTLRFLRASDWRLEGCDVDERSVEWVRRALPDIAFEVNRKVPPLPYPDGRFHGLYAVSVFTHFDLELQHLWAAEVARVVRRGGVTAITSMGPHALTAFPSLDTPQNREILEREGFFLDPASAASDEFNARGAFHTCAGLATIFGRNFEVVRHDAGGVDGFQDLTLLRRMPPR